ncbi:long chain fatty acid CoA ligase [Sarcoptes scabiei]|nr:long chain fatty acid CoA ligase [Sarcoptes scabiei]
MSTTGNVAPISIENSANYWDRNCDPRTVNLWLMAHGPWKLIGFTSLYLGFVYFGRKFMANRKPYELRSSMLGYNILLVVINLFFLYESLVWIDFGAKLFDFRFPSPTDRSKKTMHIIEIKKEKQLTVLHIYHHISVPVIGWISSWISPTMPVLGLFAMLNCFCHVIMYSYYALSALGPQLQPFLWWKKYITQIQLFQFALIGLYGICLNLWHQNYPFIYRMMPVTQAIIFLAMFGNFYIRSYLNKRKMA